MERAGTGTAQAVIAKRLVQTPPDVSAMRDGILPTVSRAVQRALSRTPVNRFESGAQLSAILGDTDAGPAPEEVTISWPRSTG